MPRVSYLKTKTTRTSDSINGLTGVAKVIRGSCLNSNQLAEKMDVSQPTAQKWLKHPEALTLEQLIKIAITYDIPREDILGKISW